MKQMLHINISNQALKKELKSMGEKRGMKKALQNMSSESVVYKCNYMEAVVKISHLNWGKKN